MFITFEGPDGSGKTTALSSLVDFLKQNNIEFILTREPGSATSNEAKKIREIILDPANDITPMTEAILYAADRRLHLEKLIWPALKQNKLVLCDRYLDSTLAYQGSGRQLGIKEMLSLQEIVTEKTFPDLTIFFDISPEESEKRVDARAPKDRLELAGKEFHQRVYDGYKQVVAMFPERIKTIDATQSKEDVLEQVKKYVLEAINKK